MPPRQESLTVTLHWTSASGEQATNIVCEDGAPEELIPLLLAGCGLPARDAEGRARLYGLKLGAATGPKLWPGRSMVAQGMRSGGHLWLAELNASPRPCLITLPDNSQLALPRRPLALTRTWLLQAMALLNPEAHQRELERLEQRLSAYRFVSKRPHCTLGPDGRAAWTVSTNRDDVITLLNGAPLGYSKPVALRNGDQLTLGDDGPTLVVTLLGADE